MSGWDFPPELILVTLFSFFFYWEIFYLPTSNKNNICKFLTHFGWTNKFILFLVLVYILMSRWIIFGYFPITNLYESIIFLYWVIGFVGLRLEYSSNLNLFGMLTSLINFIIVLYINYILPIQIQLPVALSSSLNSNWLLMHVTITLVGYAFLIFGTLDNIVLLFLKNKLKQVAICFRKIFLINKILDILGSKAIIFGYSFLTLGIILGAIWAREAWGTFWNWDPKETWALVTWLMYTSYLHLRLKFSKLT